MTFVAARSGLTSRLSSLLAAGLMVLAAGCFFDGDGNSERQEPIWDGPLQGTWEITWECIAGCEPGNINPLVFSEVLDIAATTLTFEDAEACVECGAVHVGAADDDCITVPADDAATPARTGYDLCRGPGGVEALITWSGYPGPETPRTWHLVGRPL